MTEAGAGRGRRSSLPTLIITLLALLAVIGVLIATGRHHRVSQFGLQTTTPVVTVTAGGAIQTQVTVRAEDNFRGTVVLSAGQLPAGLVADFTPPTVTLTDAHPSATAVLRLHTIQALPAGPVRVSVTAAAGKRTQNTVVQLQVESDGSLAPSPGVSPSPAASGFGISGSPVGSLAPGARLPIDLHLDNPTANRVSVSSLGVSIAGTTAPGCAASNFALTQFAGTFPLQLPANSHNTLSSLRIPKAQWPTLAMLNLPVNQDACKGATVQLRYSGGGTNT